MLLNTRYSLNHLNLRNVGIKHRSPDNDVSTHTLSFLSQIDRGLSQIERASVSLYMWPSVEEDDGDTIGGGNR